MSNNKNDIKCAGCGKLLMTGTIDGDTCIEKDCPRCGERNVINVNGVVLVGKSIKPFQNRLSESLEKKVIIDIDESDPDRAGIREAMRKAGFGTK